MLNYPLMVADRVTEHLSNLNVRVVDGNIENRIIVGLVPEKDQPKSWRKADFNPTAVETDARALLELAFPETDWGLKYNGKSGVYSAWVENEDWVVATCDPARSLCLAAWTAKILKEDEAKEP